MLIRWYRATPGGAAASWRFPGHALGSAVMGQRYVGRTGVGVSRLGLGTMTWGRDTDEHEAAEQLRDFLDAGGSLVDVGTAYGAGACEEVLGKLMGAVAARDEIVICAKATVPMYRT